MSGFFEDEDLEGWKKHWQGMPEFAQEDLSPYKEIVVKFRNQKDFESFMELMGQKCTIKTKSIWHPKLTIKEIRNLRYSNES